MKARSLILSLLCLALSGTPSAGQEISCISNHPVVHKAAESLDYYLNKGCCSWLHGKKVAIGLEPDFDSEELERLAPISEEGYKIAEDNERILIVGGSPRGTLYGVGALLRMESFRQCSSSPSNSFRVTNYNANPRFQNQTDPQALKVFEGQVRDIALFGANGVELLRSVPAEWVEIVHSYGLDVWIVTWDNGSPSEYKNAEGIRNQLRARKSWIESKPWIDHYLIKSGDPGDLDPEDFFAFSSMEAGILHNKFPEAKIWVCPQHYKDAPLSYFEKACKYASEAHWLYGIMAGCWTRLTAAEVRTRIPENLHLIQGPDITHIYSDMYPALDMDLALARSLGRICIHIAPNTQKHNHNLADKDCEGSCIYSEGTTDDIHKCLWASLDWEPDKDIRELLREYARVFLPGIDDCRFADGVLAIENNAIGPLEKNPDILENLALWQKLEDDAPADIIGNPRFLMPLLRAHFDAYIFKRWTRDLKLELECYDILSAADGKAAKVMGLVRKKLAETDVCIDKDLRTKCEKIYAKLSKDKEKWMFENQPNMYISQMDLPLIDSGFITEELDRIAGIPGNREVLLELRALGTRFRSTPGKKYYNLGDSSTEDITGIVAGWDADPAFLKHPFRGYGCASRKFIIDGKKMSGGYAPRSWLVQVGIWYDQPLKLSFKDLEPGCYYTLRLTYAGEPAKIPSHVKLTQNGDLVHRPIFFNSEIEGEWSLPHPADEKGSITLEWKCNYGERGVTIAEASLIKKDL